MKTRIVSALFMLPFLVFLYFKGIPLLALVFVCSIIAMHELYKGFENMDIHPSSWIGYVSLASLYMIIIWGEYYHNEQKVYAHLLCLWVFGTVVAGLLLGLFRKGNPIVDGIVTSLGALYVGFFFSHIVLITCIDQYANMVWIVFIASLGSDAAAYFVGCAIGKHKLCPEVSPKKTVEGAVGGLLGSAVLCSVFGYFVFPDKIIHCLIIGVFGAAFSQCGDLVASMFKRKMDIKDYGNLIPGHGGILDRFDSVLLCAPLVYYYILVVMRP